MNTHEKYVINSVDTIQSEFLEKELSIAKNEKKPVIITIVLFLVLIFGITISYLIVPDKTISENENRALQTMPEISFESIFNKKNSFSNKFSNYMADQFPLREASISVKAFLELSIGKQENNNVILSKDNFLVTRMDNSTDRYIENNIKGIAAFANYAKQNNIDITVAIAPRLADASSSIMPIIYPIDTSKADWNLIDEYSSKYSLDYINLTENLKTHFENGEYVYYRTDHHWTTLGAYYAYNEIASNWNIPIKNVSEYNIEIATNEFYGTTWSSSGMRWVKPDSINYFRYEDDEKCEVRIYTDIINNKYSIQNGLYNKSYLNTKDKYSSFVYENCARIDILSDESKPTMLVIRDSFASCMLPFLAENYNLIVVDVRYYTTKSVVSILDENDVDRVFILYNLDTLTTTSAPAFLAAIPD